MKKIIYSAAAMALAFFAASCQQENLEPSVSANTVTYTVEVPGALATRALGDETTAVDKVYYQVYREDLSKGVVYEGEADVDGGTASFELEFVKNQNFVVLFWAQNQNLTMFDIDDLRAVELTTPGASNNVNAQVFAGSNVVTDCVPANGGKVTLSRPISQINIATNDESLQFGNKTIEIESSTVTVKDLYPVYNVATGQVSGTLAPVTYTDAPIFNETLEVNGVTYTYAAMNYVGFAHQDGTTVEVDFTISTKEDGDVKHKVSSVPVKPNYRTNIIGNLLTEAADYDVTLDAKWNKEEYTEVVVSTASDLQTTINEAPDGEATEITLSGDINLGDLAALLNTRAATASDCLTIPVGKSIVLNLNGYSINGVDETEASYSLILNRGNLVITNTAEKTSKISLKATVNSGWGRYSSVISTSTGSTLTVEGNVVVEHLGGTDMAYGIDVLTNADLGNAKATINGATIKSTYRAVRQFLNSDRMENELVVKRGSKLEGVNKGIFFQDPSAKSNNGKLVVEEGADVGTVYLYVTAGSTSWPVEVSIASSAVSEGGVTYANTPKGYAVEEVDGFWTVAFHPVAKIGEKGYATLNDAVAAVQDGDTITLVADEEFTEDNYTDNGGWKDGLGYSGDKSFTIDLGGNTIKQDDSLNDYLVWIKNVGSKENTITFKNGTMDAGKTAYCALCTASSHENKLTVNLENITLINEISNGSTVKIRAGSELNVKAGTKIIGKNSYLGVENWNAVVNIYDGAEIYMNGTSSYNGCLVGVGGNGTINVYGGYGKGVKGGFIAMTSGGTINVAGGEWIANTNGTVGDNSNLYVLTAQSNKYESGFAGPSIINVTGGTLRGGMDAWVLNNLPEEKAELNISGGNFNVNPSAYLIPEYKAVESNGVYTVELDPTEVTTWEEFAAALAANKQYVALGADITYASNYQLQKNVNIDLNGKSMTLPMINVHSKANIANGTINGKVYARKNSDSVFENVTFSGAVADNLSTEGHLAIQSGCKLYVKDCLFSPSSVSGTQTKPVSFEGGSSTIKFEGCEFKSSPYKKQVYLNSLSATGSIDFTNCNFNNKTPNIMFAATCPLTNVTFTGTTKLSSVTFEINRAKDAVTAEDLAYLRTLISNNSFSSVRLFYAGGSSEYIR